MKYDAQIGEISNLLSQAQRILVVLPAQTSVDKLAAGLALTLSLQKYGKQVSVVTEDTLRVSHANLFGVGEVKNRLPANNSGNFVVTLEGVVDQSGKVPAENVDWYPEGQNLNLIFHVTPGQKFEPINVKTSYQDGNFDLLFIAGAANLSDLGSIYLQNPDKFSGATIVNIDNNPNNALFGKVNVVDSASASISEMMMQIFSGLNIAIDADIASDIILGIFDATSNLTQNTTANSFLAVGSALQSGGRLPQGQAQPAAQPQFVPQPVPLQAEPVTPAAPQPAPQNQGFDLSKVFQIPPVPQANPSKETAPENAPLQQREETPSGEAVMSISGESEAKPTPDWLTPKIYKGGGAG